MLANRALLFAGSSLFRAITNATGTRRCYCTRIA